MKEQIESILNENVKWDKEIEDLISRLDSGAFSTDIKELQALCENAFNTLHGCMNKFLRIKKCIDDFASNDEEPLGEWSDDALHDELFNLKESIVNHDEIESVKLLLLVTDLCKAKAIQTELEFRAEVCLRGGGE